MDHKESQCVVGSDHTLAKTPASSSTNEQKTPPDGSSSSTAGQTPPNGSSTSTAGHLARVRTMLRFPIMILVNLIGAVDSRGIASGSFFLCYKETGTTTVAQKLDDMNFRTTAIITNTLKEGLQIALKVEIFEDIRPNQLFDNQIKVISDQHAQIKEARRCAKKDHERTCAQYFDQITKSKGNSGSSGSLDSSEPVQSDRTVGTDKKTTEGHDVTEQDIVRCAMQVQKLDTDLRRLERPRKISVDETVHMAEICLSPEERSTMFTIPNHRKQYMFTLLCAEKETKCAKKVVATHTQNIACKNGIFVNDVTHTTPRVGMRVLATYRESHNATFSHYPGKITEIKSLAQGVSYGIAYADGAMEYSSNVVPFNSLIGMQVETFGRGTKCRGIVVSESDTHNDLYWNVTVNTADGRNVVARMRELRVCVAKSIDRSNKTSSDSD
jgi:hypothetical protein